MASAGRTHADVHQAIIGLVETRWPEWRLYDVLRAQGFHEAARIVPVTASLPLELAVSTHIGHAAAEIARPTAAMMEQIAAQR